MSNRDVQSEELYRASGLVSSDDPLVNFLYMLIRDELSTGRVASIFRESMRASEVDFTNGYLAEYAMFMADRLREKKKIVESDEHEDKNHVLNSEHYHWIRHHDLLAYDMRMSDDIKIGDSLLLSGVKLTVSGIDRAIGGSMVGLYVRDYDGIA